ncbi:8-oxo-dGTP pyrophosphatase MutT (NUDIX family) [Allocatelliglobosispora scoriae]|uniref:8-oxo-dGTP pyrophosphatase MutT (NUDIX family) n=1 Tax=Allocatelliglobosispora scoriae TaxID=643052 RepID=A0A841BJA9_9ACTN|nr:NUDIX domain-containing protein [Allocatelliglobosispora scoriae]MBB5867123.1 8-oxo-dGTP pyrophosphatase MutT (NUDIX family) [Allocatelliglobosispora scoriae]
MKQQVKGVTHPVGYGVGMLEYSVAIVLLVDADGALLMQLRDEHAPIAANQWGFPGGQIEAGETPVEAAHRELLEETGLSVGELLPFWSGMRPFEDGVERRVTMHVFAGRTDAKQDDVVLGEGLAMVFVPAELAADRDLSVSAALLIPMFLTSDRYAELRQISMS